MKITKKRVFISAVIGFLGWLLLQMLILPDGQEYKIHSPFRSALMSLQELEAENGAASPIKYKFVTLENISPEFRLAVLVAEDIDFSTHQGFAVNEIFNSVITSLRNFRIPRGASTISQQLAKNLYLSTARSPFRKIKEAIITYKLEHNLSKKRIFELYLNIVELGPRVFGIEAGSQYWFSKSAASLSPPEAAKLAAMLPGPNSAFSPINHAKRLATRQQILLRRMRIAKLPAGL